MPTVEQFIDASDAAAGAGFGIAVAISRDGSTLVVGASSANGGKGAVYVYTGAGFATETILTASDGVAGDSYGNAVAVSDNGAVIVVGNQAANTSNGKAYICSGAGWATEIIKSPTVLGNSFFGNAVAVSGDATVVAVGAIGQSSSQGRAYVFYGASWGSMVSKVGSDSLSSWQFGSGVALSTDGNTLVVGSQNAHVVLVTGAGKAYVFTGASWATEAILHAATPITSGHFGTSVAISGNGAVVVAGSPGVAGGGLSYVKGGVGYATETILTASDAAANADFGRSVGASADGTSALVGATAGGAIQAGQAYTYSGASYSAETIFAASDGVFFDEFGISAAFKDPGLVLVGAPDWGPAGSGDGTGRAYLYTTTSPIPPAPDVVYSRVYGIQIALSDDGVEQVTSLVTSLDGIA
jgi:hypothetical protein